MDKKLQQAIQAIRNQENTRALNLLKDVIRADPTNELAWLWISQIVATEKDRRNCLEQILKINPQNATAIRGLQILDQKNEVSTEPEAPKDSDPLHLPPPNLYQDIDPEPEPENQHTPQTEPEPLPEPDNQLIPQTEPEPLPETDNQLMPQPEPEPLSETDKQFSPQSEPLPEPDHGFTPQEETEPFPETEFKYTLAPEPEPAPSIYISDPLQWEVEPLSPPAEEVPGVDGMSPREKTINLFLGDLKNYQKRDRKFYETNGINAPIYYTLGKPPYTKKSTVYGHHPRLESRLILFPDYLVLLTEWTPEKAEVTKKMSAGSFLKEMASEGISDLTWGASDLVSAVASKVVPSESMKLLGKKPEEMLINPWSLIIPLADVVHYEIQKASFFIHYLYLHVNHRYEGELHVGVTYHSSWAHVRAEGLYKKLKKLKRG